MAQKKLGRGLGTLVSLPPASDDGTAHLDDAIRAEPPEASVLALSGRSVEEYFRVAGVEPVGPRRPPGPPPAPPEPPAAALAPGSESCAEPEPVDDLPELADPLPDEEPAATTPPVARKTADTRQYSLFDPTVAETASRSAPPARAEPAAVVRETAPVVALPAPAASPAVVVPSAAAPERASPGPLAPASLPRTPSPVAPPETSGDDDVAFVDDVLVGGVVFEDVILGPPEPAAAVPDPLDRGRFDVAPPSAASAAGTPRATASEVPAPEAAPRAPAPANRLAPEPPPEGPPSVVLVDDVVILDDTVGGIVLPDVELE